MVQGVGFRMFIVREATDLNLSGWTRNRPDGSVVIEAQGEPSLVEELVRKANIGPSKSRVTRVIVRETPTVDVAKGFHILD